MVAKKFRKRKIVTKNDKKNLKKKNLKTPQQFPPVASSSEDEENAVVSEEDLNLLQEYGGEAVEFLKNINIKDLSKVQVLTGPSVIRQVKGDTKKFELPSHLSNSEDSENSEENNDEEPFEGEELEIIDDGGVYESDQESDKNEDVEEPESNSEDYDFGGSEEEAPDDQEENGLQSEEDEMQSNEVDENMSASEPASESDDEEVQSKSKQKRNKSDDMEADYELAPRLPSKAWATKEKKKLPIKTEDGKIVSVSESDENTEDASEEEQQEFKSKRQLKREKKLMKQMSEPDNNTQSKPKKEIEKQDPLSFSSSEAKEYLAQLGSSLLSSPSLSGLTQLTQMLSHRNFEIRRLALLTGLMVYKDVIPGYRIRVLSDKEKEVKVSKDVKQLREWEQGLIGRYTTWVAEIERIIKAMERSYRKKFTTNSTSPKNKEQMQLLLRTAIQVISHLLISKPHFNLRSHLLSLLVTRSSLPDPNVTTLVKETLETIFKEDEEGEISLDAVKCIAKFVKSRHCKVRRQLIDSFLCLRLDDIHLDDNRTDFESDSANDKTKKRKNQQQQHQSRKQRKIAKQQAIVDQELSEASATVSKEHRQKLHSETLKHVFTIYFRILKSEVNSQLLGSVLQGLSKYAHLINVEFFGDLLAVLRKVCFDPTQEQTEDKSESEKKVPMNQSLHALVTVFTLLSGQGAALNIDLKDFVQTLYVIINDIHTSSIASESGNNVASDMETMRLVFKSVDLVFLKRKQPNARTAAFLKRLTMLALHGADVGVVLSILEVVRQLLIKYPSLQSLMDPSSSLGTGSYSPIIPDPDLSNALCTSLWEIHSLCHHYHPLVQKFASYIVRSFAATNTSGRYELLPKELQGGFYGLLNKYCVNSQTGKVFVPAVAVVESVARTIQKRKDGKERVTRYYAPVPSYEEQGEDVFSHLIQMEESRCSQE